MSRQLFDQATTHRKQKQFKEAINIYRPLWLDNPLQFDEWAGWSYAFCLKETKQYHAALELCRQLYGRFSASAFLKQLYASCIYYTQFGNKELPVIPVLKKAVYAMIDLYPPHLEYSLSTRAVLKLVKLMAAMQPINWPEIEEWLQKLDPDLLDSKSFSMKMPDGKERQFASPEEEWFSWMIRAKGGQNKPEALLELLEAARKRGISWHYNNDIWFARKEAFALQQLGRKKEAEAILRKLIMQKRDWFLLSDLAEVVEDRDEALQLMARAALSPGPTHLKVKLFGNIYHLLKQNPKFFIESNMHLVLITLLRLEKGWSVTSDLDAEIAKSNADLSSVNSSKEAFGQLRSFWQNIAAGSNDIHFGKIKLIHSNGLSGILTDEDSREYFFSMREAGALKNNAVPGTMVNFELVNGFNKKRNEVTRNAVRLTLK